MGRSKQFFFRFCMKITLSLSNSMSFFHTSIVKVRRNNIWKKIFFRLWTRFFHITCIAMPGFWMLEYVQIIDGSATELTDAGNFTPLIQTPHNCRLPEGWVKSSFTSKTNQHCTVVTSCQIHRYRVAWWLLIVAQPGFRLAANISLSNFTLQGWSQVLTTTVYKFCCCWDHKLRGSRFSYQRLRAGWNEGWTWWSSWLTHQPTPKPNLPQNLKPMVSFHCRRI